MSFLRRRRRRFLLFSCMQWLSPLLLRRIRPDPVTLNRFAAARLVFIFDMTLSIPMTAAPDGHLSDHRSRLLHAARMREAALWRRLLGVVKPAETTTRPAGRSYPNRSRQSRPRQDA